jgi:hypothetical protein
MSRSSAVLSRAASVFVPRSLVSVLPAYVFAFSRRSSRLAGRARAGMWLIRLANLHLRNGCNGPATVHGACVAMLSNGKDRRIRIPATLQRLQRQSFASYMRTHARDRGFQTVLSRARVALQLLQCCKNENMYIFSKAYTLQRPCNADHCTASGRCRNGNSLAASTAYAVSAAKNAIKYCRKSLWVRVGGDHGSL